MRGFMVGRRGMSKSWPGLGMILAVGILPATVAKGAEKPIRFDRDIRPLLSEHCFACHGPGKQEAGLRLDDGPAALAPLELSLIHISEPTRPY